MRSRAILGLAALSAFALLAGCANQGQAATTDLSDAEPVHIALISPLESSTVSMPFLEPSAVAAVEAINAAGGINGRPLELSICNDGFNADELRKCTQAAVREEALAVFGLLTPHGAQFWPLLEAANLPAIGPLPVTPLDATNSMSFPLYAGLAGYLTYPVAAAELLDAEKVVPVHLDTAAAASAQASFQAGADLAGIELAEAIMIPADAIDYAPYVARAVASGADAIVTAMPQGPLLKLWNELEATNSSLPAIISATVATAETIEEAGEAAEGSFAVSSTPSMTDENPSGQQFLEEMSEYAPDAPLNQLGFNTWAAVHLFAEVAAGIDGELTRDAITEAMNSLTDLDFLWFESLSFTESGPYEDAPRVTAWNSFIFEIESGGSLSLLGEVNPFPNN